MLSCRAVGPTHDHCVVPRRGEAAAAQAAAQESLALARGLFGDRDDEVHLRKLRYAPRTAPSPSPLLPEHPPAVRQRYCEFQFRPERLFTSSASSSHILSISSLQPPLIRTDSESNARRFGAARLCMTLQTFG